MKYDAPTKTGTGTWPGTVLLMQELRRLWPGRTVGAYNPRCVQGHATRVGSRTCPYGHTISHHAEARAVDVMTTEPDVHLAITGWALGMDGHRWGIQEVITGFPSPRRWTIDGGWKPYNGPSNHRDHVHLSQTIEAAQRTQPPVTPPLIPNVPPTVEVDPMKLAEKHVRVMLDPDGQGSEYAGVAHGAVRWLTLLGADPNQIGFYPGAQVWLAKDADGAARVCVACKDNPVPWVDVRVGWST